jgi:hypothetical protein
MSSADPWLLVVVFRNQGPADKALSELRGMFDRPMMLVKRSEARAAFAENISPTPKRYDAGALLEPVWNHQAKRWELAKDA